MTTRHFTEGAIMGGVMATIFWLGVIALIAVNAGWLE